jgi:hypothetical protein
MCSAPAIGRYANLHGRKPLLMLGFGVLRIRTVLYTLRKSDCYPTARRRCERDLWRGLDSRGRRRTCATGRFNLVQGSLATAVGLGAALSTTFGGKLIQHFSYRISFLSLGAIAALAFFLLWTAIPETLPERHNPESRPSSPAIARERPA